MLGITSIISLLVVLLAAGNIYDLVLNHKSLASQAGKLGSKKLNKISSHKF